MCADIREMNGQPRSNLILYLGRWSNELPTKKRGDILNVRKKTWKNIWFGKNLGRVKNLQETPNLRYLKKSKSKHK